jgi:hypothetical protein
MRIGCIAATVGILFISFQGIGADSSEEWSCYRSNSLAMALERIDEERIPEYRFVLKVKKEDSFQEENLLKDGELIVQKRRMSAGEDIRETEYRRGKKRRETVKRKGRLVYEWVHEPEDFPVERSYYWEEDTLLGYTETSRGETKRISYLIDSDGRIEQVRDEERISSYLINADGLLREELHKNADSLQRIRYGAEERDELETWKEGELKRRRSSETRDDGVIVRERNFENGDELLLRYNNENRLVERVERKNERISRERIIYDEGRTREKHYRSALVDRRTLYSYDETGELSMKEVFESGEIVKKIVYGREDTRIETIYRNGEALYRNVYKGEDLQRRILGDTE